MSSGSKFLKRKTDTKEISINHDTLVDVIASWLYATRMVDEAKDITDIQIIQGNLSEKTYLKIYTNGGKQD